jgi:hypothetical protein
MLVRVIITNTPLSRRATRLMVKLTVILALVHLFGITSLAAVVAYIVITKLNTRRNTSQLSFKKTRLMKKK